MKMSIVEVNKAVPTGFRYFWRIEIPETARYTTLVARNAKQEANDISRVLNLANDGDESDVLSTVDAHSLYCFRWLL